MSQEAPVHIQGTYSTTELCYDHESVSCRGNKCRKYHNIYSSKVNPKHCDDCYGQDHYPLCQGCTLFACIDGKCGLSHSSGYFVHCTKCNKEKNAHENEPVPLPADVINKRIEIIEICCRESSLEARCNIHHRHKGHNKIHCVYCYPANLEG